MSTEKVIELSIDETNKLRAKLGLAPLRLDDSQPSDPPAAATIRPSSDSQPNDGEEVLELSVDDTNSLREKLGLAPLKSGTKKEIVHAPAENVGERQKAADRLERAKLERQVQQGLSSFEGKSLGEEATSAKSWAAQMRTKKATKTKKEKTSNKDDTNKRYDETDLEGLNVSHAMSELQEGSTTVMTLADTSILKTRDDTSKKVVGLNEEDDALENVNLAEQRSQRDGLREKRKMELGMGRAGGYAGFDDDEFEDLGGTQAPSTSQRGGIMGKDRAGSSKKPRGFQIGAHFGEDEDQEASDLFASQQGKAISLEPARADVAASDFMTVDEDEELRQKKKKKSDAKFKKKKKKDKKEKKKKRQTVESDEEDDEEETKAVPKKGLLEVLEETAVDTGASRKRRRANGGDTAVSATNGTVEPMDVDTKDQEATRRAKFDAIMAKGNERTREAFQEPSKPVAADIDEEPDDAFLNAALAKARRLNKLREMSEKKKARGAEAVVEAVQSTRIKQEEPTSTGTVAFAVDETREFTRALRARAEQSEREQSRKAVKKEETEEDTAMDAEVESKPVAAKTVKEEPEEDEEEVDMTELAKEVKEDDILDGTTGSAAPVGRGLAGVLGMLKQTGEITRKNAGKEEMRGRAKDERTYEDYESLDLSQVVQIDERTATDKDRELARREIKLEYRDKHGRLLTRKEAFRDLSHQFHGYGSGKRKEEKKLQQIALEQAEARLASRQTVEGAGAGTLGALKATQKATGKAFIVHKTS